MRKFLLSLGVALAVTALGEPVKVGDLYYEITGASTVKVMPDRSQGPNVGLYEGKISVPSTVTIGGKTYTVTELGKDAFRNCRQLTGVTLPNTIERIDSSCFAACEDLKSLVLPSSLRVIETAGVASNGITSLTINEGLDSVGDQGISLLKIDTLRLPASLRAFAPGAFSLNHKLTAIIVADGNLRYKSVDGVLYNKTGRTLYAFPCYKECYEGFRLPSSVRRIEAYACSYLGRLQKFIFNDVSEVELAPHAMEYCQQLRTIENADAIVSIGEEAMSGLSKLSFVQFGSSLKRIDANGLAFLGNELYNNKEGLPKQAEIVLNRCGNLRYIGENAFYRAAVEKIFIPTRCDTIAPGAFSNTPELKRINVTPDNKTYTSVNGCVYDKDLTTLFAVPGGCEQEMFQFPKGLRHIVPYAFKGCSNLRVALLPEGLLSIGKEAFNGSGLVRVEIPSTITSIPEACFGGTNLRSVTVPSSVTEMGGGVFNGCKYMVSAWLSDELTEVPVGTFYKCENLAEVNIPAKARVIRYNAFESCFALRKVVVPDSVRTIEAAAFACPISPYNVGRLDTVILGRNVSRIDWVAFGTQRNIRYIRSYNPVPPEASIEGVWTQQAHDNAMVEVPEGSLQAYKYAPIWEKFRNWREFDGVAGVMADNLEYRVAGMAIEFSGEGHVEVYTLSGVAVYSGPAVRVEVPARGIYIVRSGGRTAKVAV